MYRIEITIGIIDEDSLVFRKRFNVFKVAIRRKSIMLLLVLNTT